MKKDNLIQGVFTSPRQELLNTFKSIRLEESTHTYYVDGVRYPSSTTTIVGQFAPKFDEQKMAELVANRDDKTVEEVLQEWSDIREEACTRGSLIHKALEYTPNLSYDDAFNVLLHKLEDEEYRQLFNEKEYRQLTGGLNWYNHLKDKYGDRYQILVLELMMYLPEFKHCGTADIILWDTERNMLIIADWKTNKDLFKLEYYKKRKKAYFSYPFTELLDCPYSKYILQFSHYQMMIENRTSLRVAERWCIWLTDSNIVEGYADKGDGWVQYNTPDYSKSLYHIYKQDSTTRPTSLKSLRK